MPGLTQHILRFIWFILRLMYCVEIAFENVRILAVNCDFLMHTAYTEMCCIHRIRIVALRPFVDTIHTHTNYNPEMK